MGEPVANFFSIFLLELQEASLADEDRGHRRAKRPRLEDLFRPPVDICISGSLNTARECAQMKNRWLIINVQDETIFESQTLNRDVWNNAKVKSIIKKLFLFWQVSYICFNLKRRTVPF